MKLARHDLEALLRARQLDRTVVAPASSQAQAMPTTLGALNQRLGGGFPHGQLSEIVGARSSGRTGVLCALLAAATRWGDLVALIDACDAFDPISASAAGIELSRLLWIRGQDVSSIEATRAAGARLVQRALKATSLVLQCGDFGVVALDCADVPAMVMRRIPFTTWFRLQRLIEGRRTVCVLVGTAPMARGPAGLTLTLESTGSGGRWTGTDGCQRLAGLTSAARVTRSRAHAHASDLELRLGPPASDGVDRA